MFKKARLRLTAWYSIIIMVISLSFSVAIYSGVNAELIRIDDIQKSRQDKLTAFNNLLVQQGLSLPLENSVNESEALEAARLRIIWALGFINISILVVSGIGGYLLAGLTLDPISEMVRNQKNFIGNASHELRTPLTSLKTEIEVALRDKKMTLSDAKTLLKSNLEDVDSMQRLSNYLLKLNRYEDSEIALKTQKIELNKVILKAIEGTNLYAKHNGIKVIKNIRPVRILGSEEAVFELATILIENAIKYSGDAKKINVMVKKGGFLTVRDYGIGISKRDLPYIFDRLFRSDSSRNKEKVDGYGLGLAIAKSIVERLGAKIMVQSKVGVGSTFTVQFRLV